ncbi:hypothetical protein KUTeg_003195 [Tegillarca granosa]|uniref:IRS-type PTB domain-containing protein n=1 Tax=Tegillarca granosa TaxID=220873 RepID=A0ABQ9FLG2_TEGGR|nr:hypothetical protein KUTeg_003195 [Tegillarca granosa]
MADINSVVEGRVKFRDGKKWKLRWCVLKKPSPVADSVKGAKPKHEFHVEGFYGLETGFTLDKESNVLAILCHKQITLFAFDNREVLIQFEIRIRKSLGEEDQYSVKIYKVPNSSKLPLERVRMHIHGQKFCFTSHSPPKILAAWQISDLRRFGMVEGKFVFEGGSRCGKGAGVHILSTEQAEELAEIVQMASQGKTASCRKNKRKSQVVDYLDPVNRSISDGIYKDFRHNQVFGDHNFIEDSRWPKRHSFSYSDYSKSSYSTRSRLANMESLEKENMMALYDIPPRRIKKVENFKRKSEIKCDNIYSVESKNNIMKESFPDTVKVSQCELSKTSQIKASKDSINESTKENNLEEMQSFVSSLSVLSSDSQITTTSESDQSFRLGCPTIVSVSEPALCGYGNSLYGPGGTKFISNSVPNKIDEEINRVTDVAKRNEALEKLQKEEIDLQREITLLDEILKGCKVEDPYSHDNNKDKQKPPPLPKKKAKLPKRPADLFLDSSQTLDKYSTISSQNSCSGLSDSALLSPNLLTKLKQIPAHSKLSQPLPYVNLAKYDSGDIDNSHVHVPGHMCRESVNWSAPCMRSNSFDNVHSKNRSKVCKDKLFLKQTGSTDCLRYKCKTESAPIKKPAACRRLEENVYENDLPLVFRSDSPPPKLPPKGPALMNKMKQRSSTVIEPPPLPPERRRSYASQSINDRYQSQRQDSNYEGRQLIKEENYLLMHGSDRSKNNSDSGKKVEIPTVKLPTRKSKSPKAVNREPESGYMEMSGMFIDEKKIKTDKTKVEDSHALADPAPNRPHYVRSFSASAIPDRKHSIENLNNTYSGPFTNANTAIRDENYLLMSEMETGKNSILENSRVSSFDEGMKRNNCEADLSMENVFQNDSIETSNENTVEGGKRPVIPFQNLLNFQKVTEDQPLSKLSLSSINSLPCGQVKAGNENSQKSQGFLTRLMRRNSGNRKSISQSQENLLGSSSSESCLERTLSVKEGIVEKDVSQSSSSSSSSSRCQSQQDMTSPSFNERRRSSSFPSRSCFLEMSPDTMKEMCARQDSQDSFYSVMSADDQAQLLSAPSRPNSSHHNHSSVCKSDNKVTEMYYMGPCDNHSECSEEEKSQNRRESPAASSENHPHKPGRQETRIFTVLHVEDQSKKHFEDHRNSSKTDDEKLIELMKSGKSKFFSKDLTKSDISDLKDSLDLPLGKTLSPSEQAAAIAKHVTALPPFVPPKLKNFPGSLSPVLESVPFQPKNENCSFDSVSESSNTSPKSVIELPTCAKLTKVTPAENKQQAKATLRIDATPTNEPEEDSIWVPRTAATELNDKSKQESVEEQEAKFKALIIEVEEGIEDDNVSLYSTDSSITSEDAIRCSPASTLLRPRSGREYKVIERRITASDSMPSSPAPTPTSPSAGSVFTFEQMSCSPSQVSVYCSSRDGESPGGPAVLRSESIYSRISERISPQRMYVNVDMTPPTSPLGLSLPADHNEHQLNYAQIDLSQPSRRKSRKSSQRIQKSNTIEYALIDMKATEAMRKAGKEHALSREDTLRRSDRYNSTSSCSRQPSLNYGSSQISEQSKTSTLQLSCRERAPSVSSVDSNE